MGVTAIGAIDAIAGAIQETRVESLSEPGRPPHLHEAHRRP